MARWLIEPHVARWWKPDWSKGVIAAIEAGDPPPDHIKPYIAVYDGRDAGYVQIYHAMSDGDYWHEEPDVTEKTWAVDFALGEADLVNKKIGREMIHAFSAKVFSETDADRIVSDPQRDNWPCIIAMKRAGYRDKGAIKYVGVNSMHLTLARAMFKEKF